MTCHRNVKKGSFKIHKYERQVYNQRRSLGFLTDFVPQASETLSFLDPKLYSQLCHVLRHPPSVREDLLKELS